MDQVKKIILNEQYLKLSTIFGKLHPSYWIIFSRSYHKWYIPILLFGEHFEKIIRLVTNTVKKYNSKLNCIL